MKKIAWLMVMAAAAVVRAGLVEETKSEPVLAGSIVVAPFSEVTGKMTKLGAMINNPLVPMLLCSSVQQSLSQSYGRFSVDRPIGWMVYLQTPAWDVAATNDDVVAFEDLYDVAVVYPSIEKAARMKLGNPGSTQAPDGTIHLLANENRAEELYVKFAADNRHCAFAPSPALAARALADFEQQEKARAAAAKADRPLVRVAISERGLTALSSLQTALMAGGPAGAARTAGGKTNATEAARLEGLQKLMWARQRRQLEALRHFTGLEMSVDLNDRGLGLVGRVHARPGSPVPAFAGARLPAGALDGIPSSSVFFMAANALFQAGLASEADFRAEIKDLCGLVAELAAQAGKDASMKPYAPLIRDLEGAVADALRALPCPATADWSSFALAFDKDLHPYLAAVECSVHAAANQAISDKLMARTAAAFGKQFPQNGFVVRRAAGAYSFDWAALIDFAGAQSGIKPGDAETKDLEDAKKTVARVLGATRTDLTFAVEGTRLRQLVAKPEFTLPVESPSTGEARLAAALPEIATDRPASAFYVTPYAFVRGVLLPVMAKLAEKDAAQQYQAMVAAMAAPAANSAIAAAGWCEADGGYRFLLRVTAEELKNLGAAFNAFTAASMSSALGDSADGEDEEEEE